MCTEFDVNECKFTSQSYNIIRKWSKGNLKIDNIKTRELFECVIKSSSKKIGMSLGISLGLLYGSDIIDSVIQSIDKQNLSEVNKDLKSDVYKKIIGSSIGKYLADVISDTFLKYYFKNQSYNDSLNDCLDMFDISLEHFYKLEEREFKQIYRSMFKIYHPDKPKGDHNKFIKLNICRGIIEVKKSWKQSILYVNSKYDIYLIDIQIETINP